jgi:hypothetical protein
MVSCFMGANCDLAITNLFDTAPEASTDLR